MLKVLTYISMTNASNRKIYYKINPIIENTIAPINSTREKTSS